MTQQELCKAIAGAVHSSLPHAGEYEVRKLVTGLADILVQYTVPAGPIEAHRLMVRAARVANLPPKERERIAVTQKEALSVLTPKHPVRIALEQVLGDTLADENTTLLTGAKLASAEELRYQAGRAAMAADVLAGLAGLWPREEGER